jgi:error-prone DNA polymerase
MGFYSPGTLIEDARRHGVTVLPVDLTRSAWDATLEEGGQAGGRQQDVCHPEPCPERQRRSSEGAKALHRSAPLAFARGDKTSFPVPAVRLGLRSIRGLGSRARARLEAALAEGPFGSVSDVVARSGLDRRGLRALAEAGAFDAMFAHEPPGNRRRAALWAVLAAERGSAGPLAPMPQGESRPVPVPPMTGYEITAADYRMTALSLNGHPMKHLRARLAKMGVWTARELVARAGQRVSRLTVAGLVICRQRPGTAKGFVFLTLEDETGLVNVVVTPQRFERQALLISRTPLLLVRGALQVEGRVINIRGEEFRALEADVGAEHARGHDFR